jgi:uncharacterized phiE125 gp8 family phage protein
MILSMIKEATRWAENLIHFRICSQVWNYYLDKFQSTIYMPYPPISSITHIKYYDSNNVQQTFTDYSLDGISKPGRLTATSWPSTYDKFNAVEIRFVCGFDSEDEIPDDIKTAIYLRVADLYEIRQNSYAQPGLMLMVENREASYNILFPYIIFNSVV